MNVLILTPDAVGSTLLQRVLTIYMQFHQFDKPVINLHELTNGLEKYWSLEFNRELINKKNVKNWGYYQTLDEVIALLSSVDHYKTSRLAHYHLINRGDPLSQQIPFYQYLNDNFFIIACKRSNIFEHALSMALNRITKKLNIYSAWEKIDAFYEIYRNGIDLDTEIFQHQLEAYRHYIEWSHQYFKISQYFYYEQHVPHLEKFILNLPFMKNQTKKISWKDIFGIDFNNWNKIHYSRSDVNVLLQSPLKSAQQFINHADAVHDYQQHAPQDWPAVNSKADLANLPQYLQEKYVRDIMHRNGVVSLQDPITQSFINKHREHYATAVNSIVKMIDLGIMVSGPPIKKQTLKEKQNIISNFDQLHVIYNDWAEQNPGVAKPIHNHDIQTQSQIEQEFWYNWSNANVALPVVQPTVM